jgi:hypothetical protein
MSPKVRRRSSKSLRSLLLGLGFAGFSSIAMPRSASAQARFGDKHQLVISAENLFSFTTERSGQSPATGDTSVNGTHFGFLFTGARQENVGLSTPIGPEVGGHFFIIPSLSIGGTLGYETRGASVSTTMGNATVTVDRRDESTFILLPKVGYVLSLNDIIGFWFRGGIGFARVGSSGTNPTSASDTFWLFSLDALFVVTPFQHFGFYVGPQGNLSFAGSHSQTAPNGTETSFGASYRSFSLGTGLFGYVDL